MAFQPGAFQTPAFQAIAAGIATAMRWLVIMRRRMFR